MENFNACSWNCIISNWSIFDQFEWTGKNHYFLDYNERVGDINSLKIITPKYIWNITNFTFIAGLFLLIIGLLILMKNQIKNQIIKLINDVKEMNKAYDNKGE
jgi:hypothetical protein